MPFKLNPFTNRLDYYETSGAGGGSVTSFSFTNANGFTGVVTNPTTTPNLTLNSSNTIMGPDIDFQTLGNTPIFTATGGDYIITDITYVAVNISGSPLGGSFFSFGWTAPNYDDWLTDSPGPPLDTSGEYGVFPAASSNKIIIPNGSIFQINISGVDIGFTDNVEKVIIQGFYV